MSSLGLGLGVNRFFGRGQAFIPPPDEFIIEVNTELAGTSNSDQFQFTGAIGEYDVEAYQNGDLVATFENLVNEQTITLPSEGVYELRVIIKEAGFHKMTFNNTGDRLKLLKILNWGLYGVNEPNQSNAFFGCENNTEIAGNGAWFDIVTNTSIMFNNNSLTLLPSEMNLPLLTTGGFMFRFNSITSLPSGMNLSLLTTGFRMFEGNSITDLPSGMILASLTNGGNMFNNNTINTARYSQLLIDLEANNNNNNVSFHGGNSQYNAQGEIARNALIARGWTITDGGLEI